MKKLLLIMACFAALTAQASLADWKLYYWSDSYSLDGDAAQFETTSDASVFVIKSVNVPNEGFNIGVHNSDWSVVYGWSDEGGAVNTKGAEVKLAAAATCSAWLDLPAGDYSVTFNASTLTIRFDDPIETTASFYRGGDLSMATYIEDFGAKFYDRNNQQGDIFDILEASGVNIVRLRLYNKPGTPINDKGTTYRTPLMTTKYPSGNGTLYAGPQDILDLAKRAKNHHMAICLTFNMTDYWSNATMQMIPAEWASATTLQALGDSVYNFVHRYMTSMVNQGTTPEFVSVGNETRAGMLFQDTDGNYKSFGGKTDNISNAVYLFNKAYDAIKAVSPASQVIIHHDGGNDGQIYQCTKFFQNLSNNGCKFDVIGGSYYPHWAAGAGSTDNTPTGMLQWAAAMKKSFNKPIMLMEVGYSWDTYRCPERNGGNYLGQLELNGSYNEATPEGQKSFMEALHTALASDENILGYLYWDPIFVDQKVNGKWIGTCWAEKYSGSGTTWWYDANVISNTTWFDYQGKALPVLDAIKKLSGKGEATPVEERPKDSSQPSATKYLSHGQIFILRGDKTYTLHGKEIR